MLLVVLHTCTVDHKKRFTYYLRCNTFLFLFYCPVSQNDQINLRHFKAYTSEFACTNHAKTLNLTIQLTVHSPSNTIHDSSSHNFSFAMFRLILN